MNSFYQFMEFHIAKEVRKKCNFDKSIFASTGNVFLRKISDLHNFVHIYNETLKNGGFGLPVDDSRYLKSGLLNAMGLIDEIFHYVCRLYRHDKKETFFIDAYVFIQQTLEKDKKPSLDSLLESFCTEFPPQAVYHEQTTVQEWLAQKDPASGIDNKYLALEELLLLKLANENPACAPFFPLFNDKKLAKHKGYKIFWKAFKQWSAANPPFGPEQKDLISLLKTPVEYAPYSLRGQLEYIKNHWAELLGDWLKLLLQGIDLIAEEEKAGWQGGIGGGSPDMEAYRFENLSKEYERFSPDQEWMPNVIMIAKSTLVWLDQLSKKYQRDISRLDQIPNEEIEFLAKAGFNALWLIGIWERSPASARIKQICGNPEAASSAYSLDDYEIAESLGGWQALENLRDRAWQRGVKLAADMVPNHTGLDSRWVVEKPDLFIQRRDNPFPGYNYDGENLSHDGRVGIYLENHYYSKTDCAVVFKRVDHYTGDVRYIYHGNDGTGLPWNDTAQIDFLNPQAREEVMQKILHVARNFPIIRFDAAMVLAKKHIRRLWYPQPGHGGDIASRSQYAMSIEEFEKRIPEEFWREVVDRIAHEIPDTLLLAEAFWMMEGYFVRTLGMHRVYNSAFMNMLKKEDNAKYRLTIKNTMEFDPEVLKRYVNFMNNPDEETAVAQFGNGDKYFGVCTMMVAMPGLPMFGHGQIEGFEEKYGMEYQRAYYDEKVNEGLVERHRREIFPLMKRRAQFSGVEHFLLYDFWSDGRVNENVFAWSNYAGKDVSLILYNNKYDRASGWIKTSAAFAAKDSNGNKYLVQKELAEGLCLTNQNDYFTLLKEQRSGLWYIRTNRELIDQGFFAQLDGFQCQVFLDIHQVQDNAYGHYRMLYDSLEGKGIADVSMGINNIHYKDLYAALKKLITKDFFHAIKSLISSKMTVAKRNTALQDFIESLQIPMEAFLAAAIPFINEYVQTIDPEISVEKGFDVALVWDIFKQRLHYFLLLAEKRFPTKIRFTKVQKEFFSEKMSSIIETENSLLAFAGGLVFYTIADIMQVMQKEAKGKELINLWRLDDKIQEILSEYGFSTDISLETLELMKASLLPLNARISDTDDLLGELIHSAFSDKETQSLLGLHNWDGISWFHKERAEKFFSILGIKRILSLSESDKKVTEQEINRIYSAGKKIEEALAKSKYKTEDFLELFPAPKKRSLQSKNR
ncbi:alpha-amylase family glycosyl hydrolase [Treponema phagedenis]|uniref:alpha-amylase family glycosyl hydrolase n=1 Tax=Treponema phagedenis TaxID=162 RepID=UPI0011E80B08|nr:alpha-amylase family glycosyl hydrolase [Treponema phagedenis]QEK01004.1 alpha-amlyase [Treponema phagedenis]QEK06013.1 alpha-amlyase [Treponema phagedenis]